MHATRMIVLVALVTLAPSAWAAGLVSGGRVPSDEPPPAPPKLRLAVDNVLVGRVNPLALADLVRAGLVARLYRAERAALRDNFIFFGVSPRWTASSLRLGPRARRAAGLVLQHAPVDRAGPLLGHLRLDPVVRHAAGRLVRHHALAQQQGRPRLPHRGRAHHLRARRCSCAGASSPSATTWPSSSGTCACAPATATSTRPAPTRSCPTTASSSPTTSTSPG